MASSRTRGLIGAAGEYHVAAQLSQRGWLATITIKNAPGTDVLAQHEEAGALIAIQTKTTRGGETFILGAKDETPTDLTDSWYVLVSLQGLDARPVFYVMPRNQVAALCVVSHRNWLGKRGRGDKERRDSSMRNIAQAEIQPYREQWDWLLMPTTSVPYALPDWFDRHVGRLGLPDGHPDAVHFSRIRVDAPGIGSQRPG